jgi:hypothetical protein
MWIGYVIPVDLFAVEEAGVIRNSNEAQRTILDVLIDFGGWF